MIRAVLDVNVLVSAFIGPAGSPPDRILREWQTGSFDLVASPLLISELTAVLSRPKFERQAGSGRADAFIASVAGGAILLQDPDERPRVSEDPGDDYLIALARLATADLIVSGDKHLLDLEDPQPAVMAPRDFAELLSRSALSG